MAPSPGGLPRFSAPGFAMARFCGKKGLRQWRFFSAPAQRGASAGEKAEKPAQKIFLKPDS
jgi:hypothetical protein